jgi:hypothetical protein
VRGAGGRIQILSLGGAPFEVELGRETEKSLGFSAFVTVTITPRPEDASETTVETGSGLSSV